MNKNYDVNAGKRLASYGVITAISALAVAYGIITPDKADLWVALLVALLPNIGGMIMAIRNVKTAPEEPSLDKVAAAVVAALMEAPAPANPLAESDHGTEVQGILSEAKGPTEPQL